MQIIRGVESMSCTEKVFSPVVHLVEKLRGEIIPFKKGQGAWHCWVGTEQHYKAKNLELEPEKMNAASACRSFRKLTNHLNHSPH